MNRTACSGTGFINKGSLLSNMGYSPISYPPPLKTITQAKKDMILKVIADNGGSLNRASVVLGISTASLRRWTKDWVKPPSEDQTIMNPTRRFYSNIPNPWSVASFDPSTGEVCVDIKTPSCTTHLQYTLATMRMSDH